MYVLVLAVLIANCPANIWHSDDGRVRARGLRSLGGLDRAVDVLRWPRQLDPACVLPERRAVLRHYAHRQCHEDVELSMVCKAALPTGHYAYR